MDRHTKKYLRKRNKKTTNYLTINNVLTFVNKKCIHGIVDLEEYKLLQKINCENNKITRIINICPTVIYLNCKKNFITEFEYLPDDLETLICDDNNLSNLDNLPCGLKFLSCENNKIVRLENLPLGLEYLSCGTNPIVNLDYLPIGLTKLFLNGMMKNLKSLNDLPVSIEYLICSESIEKISKNNFPKGLILENSQLGIWKKIKT
jgi:hypothetical protein